MVGRTPFLDSVLRHITNTGTELWEKGSRTASHHGEARVIFDVCSIGYSAKRLLGMKVTSEERLARCGSICILDYLVTTITFILNYETIMCIARMSSLVVIWFDSVGLHSFHVQIP